MSEASSYTEVSLAFTSQSYLESTPFYKRVYDDPPGTLTTLGYPNGLLIPVDVLINKLDRFMEVMVPYWMGVDAEPKMDGRLYGMYLAGFIHTSDGMDAVSTARRKGAFH